MGQSTPFVGAAHRQVLNLLIERYGRIVAGDESVPRLLVLEGVSGAGKSRIVQEFYGHLVEKQLSRYGHARGRRRPRGQSEGARAGPRHVRVGRTHGSGVLVVVYRLPEGGLPARGRSPDRESGRSHIEALERAWTAHAPKLDRLGKNASTAKRLAAEAADSVAVDLVVGALGVAVPGIGVLKDWALKFGSHAKERRAADRRYRSDVAVGAELAASRKSTFSDLAVAIRSLSLPAMPAVVVIEDLHRMTQPLGEFLDEFLPAVAGHPVFVVGTSWPEGRGSRQLYAQWLTNAESHGQAASEHVPALDSEAAGKLFRSSPAAQSDEVVAALVQRYRIPHMIRLLLEHRRFKPRMSLAEVEGLPKLVADYYEERWKELPEQTKDALAWLPGSRGRNRGQRPGAIHRKRHRVRGRDSRTPGAGGGREAACPFQWLRPNAGGFAFAEPEMFDIAAEQWGHLGSDDEAAEFVMAVHGELERFLVSRCDDDGLLRWGPEEDLAAEWFLDLPNTAPGLAAELAAWHVAQRAAQHGWTAHALRLLSTWNVGAGLVLSISAAVNASMMR